MRRNRSCSCSCCFIAVSSSHLCLASFCSCTIDGGRPIGPCSGKGKYGDCIRKEGSIDGGHAISVLTTNLDFEIHNSTIHTMSKLKVKAHVPRFYAAPCNAEVTRKVFGRRKMLQSRWFLSVDATFKDDWTAFDKWFEDNKDQRHVDAARLLQKIIDPLRNNSDGLKPPTYLKFAVSKGNVLSSSHGWAVWIFPHAKVMLYVPSDAQGVWIETKFRRVRNGHTKFFTALEWEKAGVELQQRLIAAAVAFIPDD